MLTYITTSNLYWNRFEIDKLKSMPFTDAEVEKCTVKKGDLLVTSSIGGGLPPNIPVAKIKKIDVDKIIALPLFTPTKIEIVKIIAYDITPSLEEKEALQWKQI